MLGMRSADVGVDVESVRLAADGDNFRTKLVEHRRRNVIRGAIGAVDDDLQAFEIELVGERALAEFDVAARGIVDAPGLAQLRRAHAGDGAIHLLFDRVLDRVGKFGAGCGKEFDAVVFERVMRCTDDDPCRQSQRAGQIGNRRRWQRPG